MKKTNTLNTIIIIILVIILGFLVWYLLSDNQEEFQDTLDGDNAENIIVDENNMDDDTNENDNNSNKNQSTIDFDNDAGLSVINIQANDTLSSPISIEGEATGPWYFEGDFGVKLIDRESNDLISQSYVSALGDWMTEEAVEFNGSLDFDISQDTEALLVFESANPSGLPENQMTYTIPVTLTVDNN